MNVELQLQRIDKIAQNARGIWFSTLAALVFVGVTLLGHKDSDFFSFGAATQLPLVSISVPTASFFIASAMLIAALYIHLHLYLAEFWIALGHAPARISGIPLSRRILPTILGSCALAVRRLIRNNEGSPIQGHGATKIIIGLMVGWLFGLSVLFLLWWRSFPYHQEWLTLWVGFWLWLTCLTAISTLSSFLVEMAGGRAPNGWLSVLLNTIKSLFYFFLLVVISVISWAKTEGNLNRFLPQTVSSSIEQAIPLQVAHLVGAEITKRPVGWQSLPNWLRDFEETFRNLYDLKGPRSNWSLKEKSDFFAEARERWSDIISTLDVPDLRNADLRGANLHGAFLAGADLSGLTISDAVFDYAIMDGVDLRGAELFGSSFRETSFAGGDLSCDETTQMFDKDSCLGFEFQNIHGARLDLANLSYLSITHSDLTAATAIGATCENLFIGGSVLENAVIECGITPDQLDIELRDSGVNTVSINGEQHRFCMPNLAPEMLDDETGPLYATLEIAVRNGPEGKRYGSDPFLMLDVIYSKAEGLLCEFSG